MEERVRGLAGPLLIRKQVSWSQRGWLWLQAPAVLLSTRQMFASRVKLRLQIFLDTVHVPCTPYRQFVLFASPSTALYMLRQQICAQHQKLYAEEIQIGRLRDEDHFDLDDDYLVSDIVAVASETVLAAVAMLKPSSAASPRNESFITPASSQAELRQSIHTLFADKVFPAPDEQASFEQTAQPRHAEQAPAAAKDLAPSLSEEAKMAMHGQVQPENPPQSQIVDMPAQPCPAQAPTGSGKEAADSPEDAELKAIDRRYPTLDSVYTKITSGGKPGGKKRARKAKADSAKKQYGADLFQ